GGSIDTLGGNGDDVTFLLGTLTNTDDDADEEFAVIEFDALVLNVMANQAGTALANDFIASANGATSATSAPVTVVVAEPSIGVTKALMTPATQAGETVTYTLTVANTAAGANAAAGFDLLVTDDVPADLTNVTVVSITGN